MERPRYVRWNSTRRHVPPPLAVATVVPHHYVKTPFGSARRSRYLCRQRIIFFRMDYVQSTAVVDTTVTTDSSVTQSEAMCDGVCRCFTAVVLELLSDRGAQDLPIGLPETVNGCKFQNLRA